MRTDIYFKNYQGDEEVKLDIKKRFERLDKYFSDRTEASITVSEMKKLITVEITVHVNNTYLRVEVADKEIRSTLDEAIDRLEVQLKKYKSKLQAKETDSIRYELIEDEGTGDESRIVRSKKFAIKPMSTEEASLQMELLGHMFFMFLNADTEEVNVIYKRKDGNYGLIEPEI